MFLCVKDLESFRKVKVCSNKKLPSPTISTAPEMSSSPYISPTFNSINMSNTGIIYN